MKIEYTGKLYIEIDGEKTIGPGRVELLERIQNTGSIRQAALQMNMSYRQAWQQIDHLNSKFGEPLVLSSRGGLGGGTATVTEKGQLVMTTFKTFHITFQAFLSQATLNMSL